MNRWSYLFHSVTSWSTPINAKNMLDHTRGSALISFKTVSRGHVFLVWLKRWAFSLFPKLPAKATREFTKVLASAIEPSASPDVVAVYSYLNVPPCLSGLNNTSGCIVRYWRYGSFVSFKNTSCTKFSNSFMFFPVVKPFTFSFCKGSKVNLSAMLFLDAKLSPWYNKSAVTGKRSFISKKLFISTFLGLLRPW